jgi:hypothetical protein
VTDAQGEVVADRTIGAAVDDNCITDLPATTYRVVAEPPAGYAATVATRWAIALPSDARIDLSLGVRTVPPETPASPWPLAIVGIAGVGLAASIGLGLSRRTRRRR